MRKKFNKDIPTVFTENGYHKVMLPTGETLPHLIKTEVKCKVKSTELAFVIMVANKQVEGSGVCLYHLEADRIVLTLPNGKQIGFLNKSFELVKDRKISRLKVRLTQVNLASCKCVAADLYNS
ncbi:hypothetical protein SAMN05421741_11847 [Paenimyroides ummariense]|uniref:Uncharacterized protein n=1 Tax=Paenimyroides ummariense TaxID=913024 RepID=A0A1I5E1U3_9FLAO|nr:hypothetical protein [Paenimyroides ummariense]SFO05353.1 hypothetical protein SAMN05421741_11847 [Paenimyroides ummariense]